MRQKGNIGTRRGRLSPAKRALLEKRLEKGLTAPLALGVVPTRPEAEAVPLSFAQERLWFLDQLEPENPAYNRPFALRLRGPLNVAGLELALSEIVRRHETLRAVFSSAEGRPVQAITPARPITLALRDLSQERDAHQEAQARRLAAQEAQRPFDLARGPLLRATLLRLAREEHVLLLVIHHMAFDGWSATVLLEELTPLYDAFSSGRPSPLAELPIQYADFALWQRQQLKGDLFTTELAYWKDRLADAPPALDLPTDHPRPAVQTHQGRRKAQCLPAALWRSLKALCRQEEATLFMVLLAAFQVLLHRYTGREDMVVGSPISGRSQVDTERLIGFFVNTLVLRTDLSGNPTFLELLKRVREVAMGAYAHQDLPLEKLLEALRLERDLSRTPLFQVMFNLEHFPEEAGQAQDLGIEPFAFDSGVCQFDLALEAVETGHGLSCVWEYNTALFDDATMSRMLGHYQVLLEAIVADPGQRIGALPLLTEAEGHQVLVSWNDTRAAYVKDRCVHHLFASQAEKRPEAVALVFRDQQMTYGELNRRANRLAHYLQREGVGPDVLVAVCVERSLDMVVGLLGVLKAGGAYVPLDPAYPKARLAFMIEETAAPVLLTRAHLAERLLHRGQKVLCLDRDWEAISRQPEKAPVTDTGPENLAYVIYTSGSTGQPKGVAIAHRGLVNLISWQQRTFSLSEKDKATQLAALSFDITVMELWPHLAAGARIYLPPDEETALSSAKIRDWLVSEAITVSDLVTPLAESVLCLPWPQGGPLRILLTGGDRLRAYPSQSLPFDLVNIYGPTEYSAVTTWATISPDSGPHSPPPIGRPIDNTQVYLLDKYLEPVPIGLPGELHVGGVGLARGYLKGPALTAEKFIPNPFSHEAGARLYKTGDVAQYLPDGSIAFLGRMDNQVKIRGFRVELGEIESILREHPNLQDAVVVARDHDRAGRRLVAYVLPAGTLAPTIDALRRFLKERLPDYMVPAAWVLLERLPLTPSGKVDRRGLPEPEATRPD
ncbi:MAG: amino acid adenylation domain-containing protein, partial [Thermodesulfobacteriota bacterium]|nr:amino acid adenylation domain-containing protein [Thermodesulfobacteriota bacterium]